MFGFRLFKALLPDKPINLAVTNITSRRAKITWQSPQNTGAGKVNNFFIKLRKDNLLIWNNTTAKENINTLDNLIPYTTYRISVAAKTEHGLGEETTISFETLQEGIHTDRRYTTSYDQLLISVLFSILAIYAFLL